MKEQLEAIRKSALESVVGTKAASELEAIRVKYLGKKGELTGLLKQMGGLSAELRPVMGPLPIYQALPKFPAVARDIAVVCDKDVTVGALETCIRRGAKGLLKEVSLFDIYTGIGIAPGKKSVAFNLTLRTDDRSLTAAEADEDVSSILDQLKSELGAVLR